jgi:hypothetical protein
VRHPRDSAHGPLSEEPITNQVISVKRGRSDRLLTKFNTLVVRVMVNR